MTRVNNEYPSENIDFLAIFIGDYNGVTNLSNCSISGGCIEINNHSIIVKDLDLEELRNDKRIFSLILLADRLLLGSSMAREDREAIAMEVLTRSKTLAEELNLDISRFYYVIEFVHRIFIAADEVLLDKFEDVYENMAVLSPDLNDQGLWTAALVEKTLEMAVYDGLEFVALRLIKGQLSDEFIVDLTELSERWVIVLRKRISSSSSTDKSE
jgi:hypothetical protein